METHIKVAASSSTQPHSVIFHILVMHSLFISQCSSCMSVHIILLEHSCLPPSVGIVFIPHAEINSRFAPP